jgi:hypothetical protein
LYNEFMDKWKCNNVEYNHCDGKNA